MSTKRKLKLKKKIKKIKKIILLIIVILSLTTLIYSLYNIIYWDKDNKNIEKQLEKIEEIVTIEEVEPTEENSSNTTEIIEPPKEVDEFNPYWDYINMNLINVNFQELKKINNQTVGWIQVNGTNINYPYVQTTNNNYYLTHSFDKSYNKAGWIYLDYRNEQNLSNKNNILYGHSRLNNTMFGTLKKTLTKKWQQNTDNHVIKISTETENSLWQIFSVYHIEETSDYLKINFNTNQEFIDFSNMLINRSVYNFGTTLNENDKILTLSTCYGETERMVVHAKLIKKELK